MSESKIQQSVQDRVDDPILEIRNASVDFDMDRGRSRVLNDVSIDIKRDEIMGIVGESGSGKSMFASALLDAIVKPGTLSGEVIYNTDDGRKIDVTSLDKQELKQLRWEEIAMVFQGAMDSFNPTQTIEGHFKETILAHDMNLEEQMEHGRQLLTDLHLDPDRVLKSYPHELSGGMQQRALIALSLLLEPNVLVMDEPTGALDLLMQRSITNLLATLQETYDLTIIFITHDLSLVAGLADRLAVMYAFDFVEYGPTDDVLKNAAHPYTRALLKAVPNVQTPLEEMRPIDGDSPDPVNAPRGCSYHPRCPLADEQCENEDPGFHEVGENRGAACFHWEDSTEAVPYALSQEHESDVSESPTAVEESPTTATDTTSRAENRAAPLLELEKLEVHFENTSFLQRIKGERTVVKAVDDVSLTIEEEDVVALVGESGCGKTTLGKAAIGLQRPTGGTIKFRGQDVWEAKNGGDDVDIAFDKIRKSMQVIHQDPGSSLNPNRTVMANLKVPLMMVDPDMDTATKEQRILQLLEYLGMKPSDDYAYRYPHQLSGGEQQRVVLGRALMMSPDVILADEAVSALDVSLRVEMMDLMHDLQDVFGTSFLFISHDFANARYFAEKVGGRIGVMYLGKLVEIGPAQELIKNPQHPYTKVLTWATPELDPELAKEADPNPPVRDIDIPDPIDPPPGCSFHTRCPEAREACTRETPPLYDFGVSDSACFRMDDHHDYWDSKPLTGDGKSSQFEQ